MHVAECELNKSEETGCVLCGSVMLPQPEISNDFQDTGVGPALLWQ